VGAFGRLDCIFNNAGAGGVDAPIDGIDTERRDEAIALLLWGVVLGMKHAGPMMKKQQSGSTINTARLRTGMGRSTGRKPEAGGFPTFSGPKLVSRLFSSARPLSTVEARSLPAP